MEFKHPLARSTTAWTAKHRDDKEHPVLVIATTLPLDPGDKRYKKSLVERAPAREHLAATSEAASFVLINKPGDWRS